MNEIQTGATSLITPAHDKSTGFAMAITIATIKKSVKKVSADIRKLQGLKIFTQAYRDDLRYLKEHKARYIRLLNEAIADPERKKVSHDELTSRLQVIRQSYTPEVMARYAR